MAGLLASAAVLGQAHRASAEKLDELLREAIAAEVAPGCVALVWRDGALRYEGAHGGSRRMASLVSNASRSRSRLAMTSRRSPRCSLTCTLISAQAVGLGQLGLEDRLPASLAVVASATEMLMASGRTAEVNQLWNKVPSLSSGGGLSGLERTVLDNVIRQG